MVYIDRNGRVLEKRPWDVARVLEIFTALWFVVVQFFMTLIAPFKRDNNQSGSSAARRGGWGPGGGGGGGSGGGSGRGSGSGGNAGLRPNRQIGRIQNTMDCNIPGGG